MPVTKVKVNGSWVPAMPVGGGGDMTKAVYDTNDDGVVNANVMKMFEHTSINMVQNPCIAPV